MSPPPLTARLVRPVRVKRRLAVRYGADFPLLGAGFTANVSMHGLAIFGSSVHNPGTSIRVDLRLPGNVACRIEGRVAWALRGSAAIQLPNQLGLEIVRADESYYRFLMSIPGFGPDASPAKAEPQPPREAPAPRTVSPAPVVPVQPEALRPRAERRGVTLPFHFGEARALFLAGVVLNVSQGGLCFRSNRVVEVGTCLQFAAESPAGPFAGAGTVIWSRADARTDRHGLQLTQVDEGWYRYLVHVS